MDTSRIRDRLLEERTLHQQSVLAAEKEAEKIRNVISGLTDEEVDAARTVLGNDYADLSTMDLELLKKDAAYNEDWQIKIDTMITKLHSYLEASLNV